ncbi:MAG: hypothetical protein JSS98_13005 [Bacteroidetes bacterium]|nr:hypothetical protein [Bacteroidota bacterium]
MFNQISWGQYLLLLLIVVIAYYLFVWVVYFKAKLPIFSGIGKGSGLSEDQSGKVESNSQLIIREIKPAFRGRENKNELIYSLQGKLKRYNQWDEPGFRETINDFIIKESEEECSIHLSEEDLRVLWL